jgi:hypothetical protein
MTGVSYIHCCPEDHEPIPNLEGLRFYSAGGSGDVYVVVVDPKNRDCTYLQVRDRDGNYRVRRGYLVDWV